MTVVIAEGNRIVRERLREALESVGNVQVVGEAENGYRAVALAEELAPDLVLMDIAMPLFNGLEATAHILRDLQSSKVLIFSAHNDSGDAQRESDIVAFLLKQISVPDLCHAIPAPQRANRRPISPPTRRFDYSVARPYLRAGLGGERQGCLTSREIEVLRLIAKGNANKATAAELGIGVKTVEKHREHLMEKLNIHETAGLTRYAIATGIIKD